ncbi:MAG: type II toxin-antitoxin system VapC family toxin [candidate division NC10 bacterium]|nr:type II toxin-antitoxin system VapC family toxin [candidate division NC10 bacterium]MBI2454641.1 type II toxin-antitoxin system VapC family toxin [candidate division NC10 bacterium]
MPGRRRSVLDSFAMLAFLNKERGFEKVRSLLRAAETTSEPLLMNEINIGEVYYVTAKDRSVERAEEFLHRLETLPILPVSNSFADVLEAARIKARFPISYADAFVVATAVRMNAAIVTGDPEFQSVPHLVTIVWL